MPKLEQFEIKKYWQIFSGLKPADNKVNHDQVLPILYNSKLDSSVLNKIWFLADIDDDDNLDFEEFVICMRLIFDMVNKNIDSVPDDLPDWLIPGSKAKLVKERRQRKQRENADIPKVETPEIDWYISPEDKRMYEAIISSITTATDGTISFPSLQMVIKSKFFNVGTSDMEKAWTLVNPRQLAGIDRDPTLYFIHILRQRNDVGCKMPTELPPALADVCNKQRVSHSLTSSQVQVKKSVQSTTQDQITPQYSNSYLTTTNVEELENEVAQLDKQILEITAANPSLEQNTTDTIEQQYEDLLKYKKQLANTLQSYSASQAINLRGITDDLDNIEQQVAGLEAYLNTRKQELQSLQAQVRSSR